MIRSINMNKVKLLPSIFKERYDLNRKYLMSLNTESLLQNFYLEAGIIIPGFQVLHDPDTDEIHWGWEAPICQLRGHFLGHWLSAAASIFACEKDNAIKAKLDQIIDELEKCQELNGGEWIGSIPEKYFEKLEKSQYIWSPQYVMHKTLMGLTDAYLLAGNEKALLIIDKLSNWYVRWTDDMLVKNPHAIYSGEESGMLEIWVTLYEATRLDKYLNLAEKYYNPRVFRDLEAGRDTLTNCHVNASIPWSHGSARLYEVTGDIKWRKLTEAFWKNAITDRGYYCTGGQGAGEFWTHPHKLGHFLCETNQEFCTVYNMVKTASYLYKWTGDSLYADYIELNLYNGFLAQQNKYTGMPSYFLPLKAGSKKKWGSPTRDFWCCYGTMVQAQTLYSSLIYYEDNNRLVVSQYIPSEFKWNYNNTEIDIIQSINMKSYNNLALFDEKDESQMSRWFLKFQICVNGKEEFTLSLRIPQWIKGNPVITINNETMNSVSVEEGYIHIQREWSKDELLIFFPCAISTSSLPDLPNTYAFMEGPIVLAGCCDKEIKLHGDANKPYEYLIPQYEHNYKIFPWKQSTYRTINQDQNIDFVPLYEITDETYTVYFHTSNNKPS